MRATRPSRSRLPSVLDVAISLAVLAVLVPLGSSPDGDFSQAQAFGEVVEATEVLSTSSPP